MSAAAFGTAAMTLVGQNLGARTPDRAARSGWAAFAIGGGVVSFMGLLFVLLFGQQGYFGPWLNAHGIRLLFNLPALLIVTTFVAFV